MKDIGMRLDAPWQAHLEVIGSTLFQRYRKRLLQPGITWEIRRDYPGLSLPDVLIRVYAGRRIISEGQDFVALEAIRSGRWEQMSGREEPRRGIPIRRDRLSRALVSLGGALFGAYCLVALATSVAGAAGLAVGIALGVGGGLALAGIRHLARVGCAAVPGRRRQAESLDPDAPREAGVGRGVAPSL